MAQEWVNHLAHTGTLRHRGDPELGENLFCRNTALILRGRTSVMPDITGQSPSAERGRARQTDMQCSGLFMLRRVLECCVSWHDGLLTPTPLMVIRVGSDSPTLELSDAFFSVDLI